MILLFVFYPFTCLLRTDYSTSKFSKSVKLNLAMTNYISDHNQNIQLTELHLVN